MGGGKRLSHEEEVKLGISGQEQVIVPTTVITPVVNKPKSIKKAVKKVLKRRK